MFLLLAPATSTPPTPEPDADTNTQFVVHLSRGGDPLPLTGRYRVMAGVEGFDDPVITPVTDELPDLYGEVDLGVSVGGRDVFLPLLLDCESGAEWEQARRDLRAASNSLLGLTTVHVIRPDGTERQITGRARVQADSWDVNTWSVRGWQMLGLLVRCPSPWWRTLDGVREPWVSDSTPGWFGVRIDELPLAPAATWGIPRTVVVGGDVETWPTVTISGSVGTVTVAHSSGRSWSIDCSGLPSPVTVVTDPTASSVTDGAGADQWGRVAAPADLWPLVVGEQQVTVSATSTTASTQVVVSAPTLHMAAVA